MRASLLLGSLLFSATPLIHAEQNPDELASTAGARFDGTIPIFKQSRDASALDQAQAVAQQTQAAAHPQGQPVNPASGRGPRAGDVKAGVPAPKLPTESRVGALARVGFLGGLTAAGQAITKYGGLIVGGIVGTHAAALVVNPVLAVVVGLAAGLAGAFLGGAASAVLSKLAKDFVVPRLPRWIPGARSKGLGL